MGSVDPLVDPEKRRLLFDLSHYRDPGYDLITGIRGTLHLGSNACGANLGFGSRDELDAQENARIGPAPCR